MESKIDEIDDLIDNYILEATGHFSKEDVVEYIKNNLKTEEKGLLKEVKSSLEYNEMIFINEDETYYPKALYFNKGQFIVEPTKYEIQRGLLFSGHRFALFSDKDIFPTDMKLVDAEDDKCAVTKNICTTIEHAAYYYSLLGSEDMINYFIAESQINAGIISDGDPTKEITLTVFDFKEFYKKYTFEEGDAIIFEILDWDTGEFSFNFIPKVDISDMAKQKEWINSMEFGMSKVIDKFGYYINIPEQIELGLYNAQSKLLDNPYMSMESFIEKSEDVEIIIIGERTVLAMVDSINSDENLDTPRVFSISEGKDESLDDILKEIKHPMSSIEIEGFMREEIFHARKEFNDFYENCFAIAKPNFIDDGKNMVFMNFLEDMWENLLETYNPIKDEDKQRARVAILNATNEKIQWLHDLNENKIPYDKIPQDKFNKISLMTQKLGQFLKLLNNEEQFSSDEDAENIIDAVETMADNQSFLISEINKITIGIE